MMTNHISNMLTPLSMDSTISEFRKKYREDREFQEHCNLQRGRKDGKGSAYWSRNVDFVMAILLGGCYNVREHPEAQKYCKTVLSGNVTNWLSSIASKLSYPLPPRTGNAKRFTEEVNKFRDWLNQEIENLYNDIPQADPYDPMTLQQLVNQVANSVPQSKDSKDPTLIKGNDDIVALQDTLKELIAPSAMEHAANLINHGEARQIVFTGAPGTGKTYIAKELANRFFAAGRAETLPSKNGEEHPYVQVQFHPSYDYTDFVEGLRPIELKSADASNSIFFGKVDGQFKQFCRAVVEKNAVYTRQKETEIKKFVPALSAALTDQKAFTEQVDALSQMLLQAEEMEPGSTSYDILLSRIRRKQALAYQQELAGTIRSTSDEDVDAVNADFEDENSEESDASQTDESEIQSDEDPSGANSSYEVSIPRDELKELRNAFAELLNNPYTFDDEKERIEESRRLIFADDNHLNHLTPEIIENLLTQMVVGKDAWYCNPSRKQQTKRKARIANGARDHIIYIKEFLIARMNQQISPEQHNCFAEILLLASHQEQAEKLYRILCDGEEKDKSKELAVRYRNALLKKITTVLIDRLQTSLKNDILPAEHDMWTLQWLKNSIPNKANAHKALETLESEISIWSAARKQLMAEQAQADANPAADNEASAADDDTTTDGKTALNEEKKKDAVLARLDKVCSLQEADFSTSKAADCKLNPKKICLDSERIDYPLYFFIIDEINRANLSKVFGELMYCLEKGKRGKKNAIKTQYQNLDTYDISGAKLKDLPIDPKKPEGAKKSDVFVDNFYIPKNVVVLGTMNDIDRSVDSMDFALRRRFEWIEFKVTQETLVRAFEAPNFGKGINKYATELAAAIMNLNEYLTQADGLRYGLTTQHYISHGYFADLPSHLLSGDKTSAETFLPPILEYVWKYRVESLLREYLRGHSSTEIDKFIRTANKKWLSDT